jgi:hypothetical protein
MPARVYSRAPLFTVGLCAENAWPRLFWCRDTWQHVAAQLAEAANGGNVMDVSISLRLALMLEKVQCRTE